MGILNQAEVEGVRRLYRGLRAPYRPELVGSSGPFPPGTNFIDCPYLALGYASTPRGVVLVLEVPPGAKVSEEPWLDSGSRRFTVWGRFDSFIIRVVPAKELCAQLRKKGVVGLDRQSKALLLEGYIERLLRHDTAPAAQAATVEKAVDGSRRAPTRNRRPRLQPGLPSTIAVTPGGGVKPGMAACGASPAASVASLRTQSPRRWQSMVRCRGGLEPNTPSSSTAAISW
jgi:hypothetical protein